MSCEGSLTSVEKLAHPIVSMQFPSRGKPSFFSTRCLAISLEYPARYHQIGVHSRKKAWSRINVIIRDFQSEKYKEKVGEDKIDCA